jgi:cytochrome P450 family 142 subfamily A polypeptide 1
MEQVSLFDKEIYKEPYAMFKRWRNESPVVFDAERNTYGITRYADVMSAFRSPDLFTSSLGARANSIPQPFMIDADDPSHREQRRVVERAFTPGQMAFYEDSVRSIVSKSIKAMPHGEPFDMVKLLTQPLPVATVGKILGVPESDYGLLQRWGESMVEGADGWENVTDDVVTSVLEWFEYFDNYAKNKTQRSDGDLISLLLNAHYAENIISYEEARGNSLALLVGGNETARYLLTGALQELLGRREVWEKLFLNKELINSAIDECVRFVSPAVSSIRNTTTDVRVGDCAIPKNSQVMLLISSANRDEAVFENPEEFSIKRPKTQSMGFGFGIHYCIGSNLARMQLRLIIEELLRAVPSISIVEGFEPEMKYSTFLRGPKSLKVVI